MFKTAFESKKTRGKKEYTLLSPLIWDGPKFGKIVAVTGFVTDLASVPERLYSLVPDIVDQPEPAVIHDYNYRYNSRDFTRAQADKIFYLGLRDIGVSWVQAQIGWIGVRIGGSDTWNKYRGLKMEEEKPIYDVDNLI